MQSLRAPAARGAGIARRRAQMTTTTRSLPPSSSSCPVSSSSSPAALQNYSNNSATPTPTKQQRLRPPRAAGAAPAAAPAAEQVPLHPPAAETARTVMALAREGALATVVCSSSLGDGNGDNNDNDGDGGPLSTPVAFGVARDGRPYVTLPVGSPEARNLERDSRCSVLLAPPSRCAAPLTLTNRSPSRPSRPTLLSRPQGPPLFPRLPTGRATTS
jgi:hypothetical protein